MSSFAISELCRATAVDECALRDILNRVDPSVVAGIHDPDEEISSEVILAALGKSWIQNGIKSRLTRLLGWASR